MFSVIALVGDAARSRVILLPLGHKVSFHAEHWLKHLKGEEMHVTVGLFPLSVGDWIVRNVKQAIGERQLDSTVESLKAYITQLAASVSERRQGYGKLSWRRYLSCKNYDNDAECCRVTSPRNNQHEEDNLAASLLGWLQGRKLLYDEWLSLAKERQAEEDAEQAGRDREVSNGNDSVEQLMSAWRSLMIGGHLDLRSAVEWNKQALLGSSSSPRSSRFKLRCLRCYETKLVSAERDCRYCGQHCYYCSSCLQMGRARTCAALIVGHYHSPVHEAVRNPVDTSPETLLELEEFDLSDAQHMATTTALRFVHQRLLGQDRCDGMAGARSSNGISSISSFIRRGGSEVHEDLSSQFLLWAVTGAGKTEMIFPLIAYMLKFGGSVLLATPRRDVVLELSPRLRKAFPQCSIVTLYGGSEERWQRGQLYLATTHQLMRFQHAFDLVIIDELDAFPYHGDERLYRVAAGSRVPTGVTILLSATPPAYLQKEMNAGKLAHVKLPVRYHRHPLPVPIRLKVPLVVEQLSKQLIPNSVKLALARSLQEDAQIFIFLQRIVHTEAYAKLLRGLFPNLNIQATSSKDIHRSSKVTAFRQREIRILVTTTILERGVTVPRSHVYICDAEAELFDEAALVQMAGRAGRSGDAPNGAVYFLSQQWSSAQKKAIRQIQTMNKLASEQGYLLPQYTDSKKGSRTDREDVASVSRVINRLTSNKHMSGSSNARKEEGHERY